MSRNRGNPYAGPDPRTIEAKKQGYPARSVFKLEEINKKTQLLKKGMRVLDLGAAPGSWSLFASQQVGQNGRVLAVDLQEITQGFAPNVKVVKGDAFDLSGETLAMFAPYDVILSDMAPKTTGVKLRDQALSYELFERALKVAQTFGKPGVAALVVKIFMGPDFDQAIAQAKAAFKKTRVIRPEGVRPNSKEVFLVGQELRSGGFQIVTEVRTEAEASAGQGEAEASAKIEADSAT
jgi:23S rRNA (uridine2552-2'-O)-methyltransferase